MTRFLIFLAVFLGLAMFFFTSTRQSYALYDPLSVSNNFYGIHILFPSEIDDAAKLVNSSGGDWGYVTIPIQIEDRDYNKWEDFMLEARKDHIIPILRISTEADPSNTSVWRIPDENDIVDLANFLNTLDWPIENRYIIAFNEENRYDEWGGSPPDPQKYTDILEDTVTTFKKKNPNFFIIMGGLDNAAPDQPAKYISDFAYLQAMVNYKPDIFDIVDGFASHSYPNPNFQQPPSDNVMGVSTYLHEYDFINSHTKTKKPVFITETGWDSDVVSDDMIAKYYTDTFNNLWSQNEDKIVAITPFLLESNGGFDQFSFYKNGEPTAYYDAVQKLSKTKGTPKIVPLLPKPNLASPMYVLSASTQSIVTTNAKLPPILKLYFKSILGME